MPGLARDSHALKMDGVVERALEQAGLASAAEVDAVAVTVSVGCRVAQRSACLCFRAVVSAFTAFLARVASGYADVVDVGAWRFATSAVFCLFLCVVFVGAVLNKRRESRFWWP